MSSPDPPPNATAGGMNVQFDADGDSESERGSTDSDDDFTSDGESDSASGQNLGQPDITNFLSTFTPFPKLPVELRLKIWKYGCLFTRNVDIRAKEISGIVCKYTDEVAHYFHSYAPPPPLLHICRESRSEALKHYQLEFGTTFEYELAGVAPEVAISTPPRIYINWAVDRIWVFCPDSLLEENELHPDESPRFQKLFNRCCKMKLRSLAWNFSGLDSLLYEFIQSGLTVEEVFIFSDARWKDRKQCQPVGEFEFDKMGKHERDVLRGLVEGNYESIHDEGWDGLDFMEYPLNLRYRKLRTLAKPT